MKQADFEHEEAKDARRDAYEREDKANPRASGIASALREAQDPEREAALDSTESALKAAPEFGTGERAFNTLAQYVPPSLEGVSSAIHSSVYGDAAESREQNWNMFKNSYINQVTGSGGSTEEMKRIIDAAE